MTLKPQCDCSTCACANAPGRSGYCLNCEVTDSGAEGSHAQPETPEPIDWSGVEAPNVIAAYPAAHAELVRRWNTHEVMLEALKQMVEFVETFDSFDVAHPAERTRLTRAKAALAAAERPGDTQS